MSVSLQVLYPATAGTTFDFEYYETTHLGLVSEHMGPHITRTVITKGEAGGDGGAPEYHVIATLLFADKAAFEAAMAQAGPVVADIAKFYNHPPEMLVGYVMGE